MTADLYAAAREAVVRTVLHSVFKEMDPRPGLTLLPSGMADRALLALDAPARLLAWLLPELAAKLEAAIEASQPDCRWTPDPDGIEICDEHSEIVHEPEGCEDSPRWWKAKAINVVRAALTDPATDGGVK